MLANVVAAYLDTMSEREFDAPFMALLRAIGYYDIHSLHGSFEFGKDFIAKKQASDGPHQYVFQSKAGDINQTDWRQTRLQLDSAYRGPLAHPNLDPNAPRHCCLVFTGDFVGGAAPEAQAYEAEVQRNGAAFEVWTKTRLVELITGIGPTAAELIDLTRIGKFLQLLGGIHENTTSHAELFAYYETQLRTPPKSECALWSTIMEWGIIAHQFQIQNRDYEAYICTCYVSNFCWFHIYLQDEQHFPPTILESAAQACGVMTNSYGRMAVAKLHESLSEDPTWTSQWHPADTVALPSRCHQALELLSFEGIKCILDGNNSGADRLHALVANLLDNCPAAYHPISEHFAASIWTTGAFLLFSHDNERCRRLIHDTAVWLVDRHMDGFGLACPWEGERRDVDQLLGVPFNFVELRHQHDSYIATALLELASLGGFVELYNDTLNDILLAQIRLPFLQIVDSPGQFLPSAPDAMMFANVEYPEPWPGNATWPFASHQKAVSTAWAFVKTRFPWVGFQNTLCCRDRIYPGIVKTALEGGHESC